MREGGPPGPGCTPGVASGILRAGGTLPVTLQELCAARGLTLAALADRAGVPFSIVTKIDAGTIRAQPVTLDRLAASLGLTREILRAELSAARRLRPRPDGSRPEWR